MSVQVRTRRDSYPNVLAYTGGNGEIIIDADNNRLTVNDGQVGGGWPHAKVADLFGRNLIINGNFAVNQRGYASGTALAAGAAGVGYAHDRWRDTSGAAGTKYTFTPGSTDTTITITAGQLGQVIDGANITSSALMVSWVGTAKVIVTQGGSTAAISGTSYADPVDGTKNYASFGSLAVGTAVTISFTTGTVGLVQCEAYSPGMPPTKYERRLAGVELLLCQRYFCTLQDQDNNGGVAISGAAVQCGFTFPAPMRAIPSVSLVSGTFNTSDGYTADYNTSSPTLSFIGATTHTARIIIGGFSGLTAGKFMATNQNAGSARIWFNAEL